MYVSALVMIKEKVIKTIPTEITNWFANWNDDRKFHPVAGMRLQVSSQLVLPCSMLMSTKPHTFTVHVASLGDNSQLDQAK